MRAWVVHEPGPVATGPLRLIDRPVPEPGQGQLLIKVLRCGVCRTDLHLTEGDLPPKAPDVTPGHECVGEVVATGPGVSRFGVGDRVGAAWLAGTDGSCRYCRSGREDLCPKSIYTGWDIHGGYAEYLVAADAYVYELPKGFSDAELAPLLCAGIIGYRALKLADLPPGGRLGAPGRSSCDRAGRHRARVHARREGTRTGPRAWRRFGAGLLRPLAGAARLGDPVRSRRHPGAAGAGRAGPRRHAGRRRDLPDRHSLAAL